MTGYVECRYFPIVPLCCAVVIGYVSIVVKIYNVVLPFLSIPPVYARLFGYAIQVVDVIFILNANARYFLIAIGYLPPFKKCPIGGVGIQFQQIFILHFLYFIQYQHSI